MNGLLLLNKPAGMSSNYALQAARRLFNRAKAGHLGTLDPLASGLLPIAFGDATKFAQYGICQDKSYEVTFSFGERSTTGDREGDIIETGDIFTGDVEPIFKSFVGGYEQQVPSFSAVKVAGKQLYKLARQGQEFERPSRFVEIYSIELIKHEGAQVTMRAHVGKGTYIRALVEDIGRAVGTVAITDSLHRVQVGSHSIKDAVMLSTLTEASEDSRANFLLQTGSDIPLAATEVSECELIALRRGLRPQTHVDTGKYRLYHQGEFVGLGEVKDGTYKAIRLTKFNPKEVAKSL